MIELVRAILVGGPFNGKELILSELTDGIMVPAMVRGEVQSFPYRKSGRRTADYLEIFELVESEQCGSR